MSRAGRPAAAAFAAAAPILLIGLGAAAHPGHGDGAAPILAGLAHPASGLDHLLLAVLAGLAAWRQHGPSRWALPVAFLAAVPAGVALAGPATGFLAPAAILAALAALGLSVAVGAHLTGTIANALGLGAGLAQGLPHASIAAASSAPAGFTAGLVAGTAGLAMGGAILGHVAGKRPAWLARAGGAAAISGALAVFAGLG